MPSLPFGRLQWKGYSTVSLVRLMSLSLLTSISSVDGWGTSHLFKTKPSTSHDAALEYDMVIIGAGASGLFASGAATMLGAKTLMVDVMLESSGYSHPNVTSNVGGDCTNSACVPSKAIRSVARMAAWAHRLDDLASVGGGCNFLGLARNHASNTVMTVRRREDPNAMVEHNPNLHLALVTDCHFVSSYEVSLDIQEMHSSTNNTRRLTSNKPTIVRGKKFLIATGARPVIPRNLKRAAEEAGLMVYTYQTLLRPSSDEDAAKSIWQFTNNETTGTLKRKRIVIAGGGASACELGQSLARLASGKVDIDLVAPTLLRGEDATLQNAAAQLLSGEGLNLHLGRRMEDVLANRTIRLSDGSLLPPCDALVLCLGRSPGPSLKELKLENAGVKWNETTGVTVKTSNLQSISASHIYACGDCCSSVASIPLTRTATHAAWTGYFSAANACLPRFVTIGSKAVHDVVPRVIYTDPELISIGMSLEECIAKYGLDGFDRLLVPTAQTDRADMELLERGDNIGFMELRATKIDGKILGMTACGPAASEIANEVSIILQNGLRAIDVARSLHSYPSHGYLLHRLALAIAFSSLWGSLEASGAMGKCVAWFGRKFSKGFRWIKNARGRRKERLNRRWEAEGASKSLILSVGDFENKSSGKSMQIQSFLDLATKKQWSEEELTRFAAQNNSPGGLYDLDDYRSWLSHDPQ